MFRVEITSQRNNAVTNPILTHIAPFRILNILFTYDSLYFIKCFMKYKCKSIFLRLYIVLYIFVLYM